MSAGGGKGSSDTSSPAADKLAGLAQQFATETGGLRTGLIDSMNEVLTTGGSTIPIISAAIEKSKQAASNATQQTEEQLAREGLSGTPFGAQVLAGTRQQGEQAAAQTSQSLAQQLFSQIANFVLGQSQSALSGLAGAIPGMNQTTQKQGAFGI
jgi:hypothetical protein